MTKVIDPPKPPRTSWTSYIGYFCSVKNGCQVFFRSLIELWYMFFLENDPDVISYRSEPFTIVSTAYLGESHHYTPDFDVIRKVKGLLVECKPEDNVQDEDTIRQVVMGKSFAGETNRDHLLVTNTWVEAGYRLYNYRLFYRYARHKINYDIILKCNDLFGKGEPVTILDLALALSGNKQDLSYCPAIYHLLFTHYIETNVDEKVDLDSIIYLSSQNKQE